jgi:uncharacterized membrane protein YfcA
MSYGLDFIFVGMAALCAGAINAIAGGGTLLTFPVLSAVGVPLLAANVTNMVALSPGYLGGIWVQAKELRGRARALWVLLPAAMAGGLAGAILLLNTDERVFRSLVPWLIIGASLLTLLNEPIKAWIARRGVRARSVLLWTLGGGLIFLAGVYGGYFIAGLSIIVMGVLGLVLDDSFKRLNALKQVVSFSANITATVLFAFSGEVLWLMALVMALAAFAGGAIGGRLVGRVSPGKLRWCVAAAGAAVGVAYLI